MSITTLAIGLAACVTVSGCALNKNAGLNLITRSSSEGASEFDFVMATDLIKESGGDKEKAVNDALLAELKKHQYCPNGHEITFRGYSQGAGYLILKGRCL